jgi:hypothetical protein
LHQAVKTLRWRELFNKTTLLRQSSSAYFDCLSKHSDEVPKTYQLLNSAQIEIALDRLTKFLKPIPGALYSPPDGEAIEPMRKLLLRGCPPVSTQIASNSQISNATVDFRTILFSGWLAWMSRELSQKGLTFLKLNMLCQRGILQQRSVDVWTEHKLKLATHDRS